MNDQRAFRGLSDRGISASRCRTRSASSRSTAPRRRIRSRSIPTRSCATSSAALAYASDVKAVVIAGAGGNFCSGGDVHEIIGPLTKMTMPELLDFTRMTGDLVKAMRQLPAADRRRDRRRLRRRGRDARARRRLPLRHRAVEDRVPLHARRARRLRHGRLHAAAAAHRPGTRGRAALHRPLR